MDCEARFRIVFQKLADETTTVDAPASAGHITPDITVSELDEIRELRRLSLEIREPEGRSYTTT